MSTIVNFTVVHSHLACKTIILHKICIFHNQTRANRNRLKYLTTWFGFSSVMKVYYLFYNKSIVYFVPEKSSTQTNIFTMSHSFYIKKYISEHYLFFDMIQNENAHNRETPKTKWIFSFMQTVVVYLFGLLGI